MKKITVFLVFLFLVSCAPAAPTPSAHRFGPTVALTPVPPTSPTNSAQGIPNFDHIVLMLLENESFSAVIGNQQMPHLNDLVHQNVLLGNYFAIRHPSLPNYIALMSGSTQNITKDCTDCFVNQPNLADRIEASGRTWKSYLESMPSPCFIGDSNPYAQKHNPLLYFDSVRLNADRCNRSIVPLTTLDTDLAANQLPNFSFIMPNLCNSGHNCDMQTADTWVYNMVTKLQSSPALGGNSLIIITFDEGEEHNTSSCCGLGSKAGGQVATLLISPSFHQHSFVDNTAYDHYSLLKMILSAWKLPDLGNTASAPQILAPWEEEGSGSSSTSNAITPEPNNQTNNTNTSQPQQATGINCVTSSPTSGTYSTTICFSSPNDGSTLSGDTTITAAASTNNKSVPIQRVVFYLDGSYLLTDFQSPYTFTLPTANWANGSHTISAEVAIRDNFTSQRSNLSVKFNNAAIASSTNPNQFQPTSGNPPVNGAPFIVAAGGDGASGEVNATNVTNLIASIKPNLYLYLGDVYEQGSPTEFYNWYSGANSYFSRFRSITDPTVGNHEYLTQGAAGYFNYWDNIPSYYSFNANGWHFISLNSNASSEPTAPSSAQYKWLQQDLASNTSACTIAYYHHPLFNIGPEGSTPAMQDIWSLMAQHGVDIVLNGHDHDYQRWVPLDGSGQPNPNGITEFIAGASGHGLQTFTNTDSRVAYSNDTNPTAFGVLLFQLNPNGANFTYRSTNGSVLDSGVIPCVPTTPDTQAPTNPSGFSATASGATKVDLTWSASSDNTGVSGYTIYRNGSSIGTVPAANLGYSDTTALPNTTYTYSIDAFDLAGNHSAKTNTVSVTTPSMPASLTFQVSADAYVSSNNPNTNYGSATAWRLDSTPDLHSYLRFNVQGLAGTPVTKAELLVYANNGTSSNISVHSVQDNSWDEMKVNYNNAPALGNTLATSGAFTAKSWVTLDVTSYVTKEGTYTFGITTSNSSTLSFPSREAGANSAQLVLHFSGASSGPASTAAPAPTVGASVTFTPTADTYVNAGSTSASYGNSTTLRADASPDIHDYLRFNVTGLGGKTVSKARLLVYANTSLPPGVSALAVTDNSWNEMTVNYANAPSLGSTLATLGPTPIGSWATFDVTPYITGEGTYNFAIINPSSTAISIASRESGANSPQLIIDLNNS